MENPDTLILNLTFLGTVGVAFLMFLVLFLLGVITLVLAGLGRLAAAVLVALFGRRSRKESLPLVQLYGTRLQHREGDSDGDAAAGPVPRKARRDGRTALKPGHLKPTLRTAVGHHPALTAARHEPPVLADDWAAAVADADARAAAKARAATPDIKVSVRDLPDPQVPAEEVAEVAPLVESALDNSRPSWGRWTPDHWCPCPARRTSAGQRLRPPRTQVPKAPLRRADSPYPEQPSGLA